MFNLDYGTRLDKFDYERFGVADRWYIRDTIVMLTSFEMEINGYYNNQDVEEIYSKVYHKYLDFMDDCLVWKKFQYFSGITDEHVYEGEENHVCWDIVWANYQKNDFIRYITDNNVLNIDINKLMSYLKGEGVPLLIIKKEDSVVSDPFKTLDENKIKDKPISKDHKMQELSIIKHKSRNDAKINIQDYVKKEMAPPCTCLHSQMYRYIKKKALKPDSGISLEFRGGKISDTVLLETVKLACEKNRIQQKNMVLNECPVHGLNN